MVTVSRIGQCIKNEQPILSPKKKKPRRKSVTEITRTSEIDIRNTIYEMYQKKQHVIQRSILEELKEKDIFNGGLTSLNTILKKIGFRWLKDSPRTGLMELPHIVFSRFTFLEAYVRNMRSEEYEFVYLDETWIFENGSICRSWQDGNKKSVKSLKIDGTRYIILHAGNKNGFIPGASLVFSSKTKESDYHGEMNQYKFLSWFENQLIPNLKKPSMFVMDNASYHSTLENKVPNSNWNKADIKQWLLTNNVAYEEDMYKKQLLHLVLENKPKKTYVVDKIAEQYNHKVLRLPPYHCIFNPIENIWGITKSYYNRHIGRDGYGKDKCISLWKEALSTITPEVWENTINHTEKEIQKWWDREVGFDKDDAAELIIHLGDDSDTTCDSDSD